jgi:Ankyrin repeats (3 copies)
VGRGCHDLVVGRWLAQRLAAWPVWPVEFTSVIGIAASKGQTEKVKAMLEDCDEDAKEALEAAAANGQVKLLDSLLPHYRDEIDDCMVTRAAARGEVEVLKLLLPYHRPDLALHIAASAGQESALKLLLELGTNVHIDQNLALRLAVASSRPKAVQVLLEAGANWRELNGNFGGPELRGIFSRHAADATSELL